MNRVVNLALLAHPVNWAIVWTTLIAGGFAWKLVHDHLTSNPTPVSE